VLRLRRLKWSLIRAPALEALEDFLGENLDYDLYSERFADDLAEILQDSLPEDQADDAQTLAHEYARNEADAVDKVKKILAGIGLRMDLILDDAKGYKAKTSAVGRSSAKRCDGACKRSRMANMK
jgi:hypothetical protein